MRFFSRGWPWLLCLLIWCGCRPSEEIAPEAVPLPLADRDRLEDGQQLGRWPAWRGWNGSGVARGGRPAVHFSESRGWRWKVPVPGEGNSSPVIWDDVILLTTALGDSDPPRLAILCYRRSDGSLRWHAEVGRAEGSTHNKNGYASATVATDGERVFAFFGTTGLFCYDLDGQPLWHADLGTLEHQWGTASSPVLVGDQVIQLCDCAEGSYLAAFDRATGQQRWRTPRPSKGCWTTPVLVDPPGETPAELVVNGGASMGKGDGMVVAYDPEDGRVLWQVHGTTELVTPTILVGDGLIYSTSGRNGPIMAIRPGGRGDVTETHVVWRYYRGGAYIPSGVLYRNRLYLVGDSGTFRCYNAGNGQPIWEERVRGPFTASLIAADGRIYAVNERGIVYVIRAADSFQMLAENDLDERCLATPAVADGDLFIRTADHLYCIPAVGQEVAGQPRASGPG